MKFFNSHISPKIILNILLGIAIAGMVLILLSVNRMNSILSVDIGFNKDHVKCIKTTESTVVLTDSLIFSSDLPGFSSEKTLKVQSEYINNKIEIDHQFISDNYFDFFNYKKINEKKNQFSNAGNAQPIYINESAAEKLGILCIDDAQGTIISDDNDNQFLVCGVVEDFKPLSLLPKNQAKIYQLTTEHLTYAFNVTNSDQLEKEDSTQKASLHGITSFQQQIQDRYKIWEDMMYSLFLFINVLILLICLGHIGSKYAFNKERELVKIFSIGVHVITLLITKTYIFLIGIMVLVVLPASFLIQKLWLEIYVNRVNFGLVDLFIILSMALLAVYLICCPKRKFDVQLKGRSIQHNSI
jgi:hypothetical protein